MKSKGEGEIKRNSVGKCANGRKLESGDGRDDEEGAFWGGAGKGGMRDEAKGMRW